MGQYFDKSQTDMTWALNAYTLAFGGLLLLGGRAGDILGRRQMFIFGLGLFIAGQPARRPVDHLRDCCWSVASIQGVGGAIAAPTALSLITTAVPGRPRAQPRIRRLRRRCPALARRSGLLLGGILTEYLDWRWVLFVNVPIGVALMIGAIPLHALSPSG